MPEKKEIKKEDLEKVAGGFWEEPKYYYCESCKKKFIATDPNPVCPVCGGYVIAVDHNEFN